MSALVDRIAEVLLAHPLMPHHRCSCGWKSREYSSVLRPEHAAHVAQLVAAELEKNGYVLIEKRLLMAWQLPEPK